MVLWPLLQGNVFNGIDGAGRIGWGMMLLAVLVNGNALSRTPKILLVWGGWIIYNIILSQIKGFQSENISYPMWAVNSLIKPFVTLLVAYHTFRKDTDRTIKSMFYCWLIFVVVGMAFMQGKTSEAMGSEVVRQSNEMGNTYVNASIFLLMFAFCALNKGLIKRNIFLLACIVEVIAIILSGSRKGILSIFIIFFVSYIGNRPNMDMKNLLRVVFISVIAYIVVQLIMTYTVAGARIQEGQETTKYDDNWFLAAMGDRGFMYDYGWELFLDNPLTGIGLQNFRWNNPVRELAIHSEYMVQLCECGIIGSALFLVFYYGMAKRIIRLLFIINTRQMAFPIMASFVGFIIMSFFAWTYTFTYYFIFFGFIYAYYDNNKFLSH